MPRFDGGYVKLWRSVWTSPVGKDGGLFQLFCWLVCRANRYPTKALMNAAVIPVPRGSLVAGMSELAGVMNVAKSTIKRRLERLQSLECIRYEGGTQGTLITVLNYDEYQNSPEDSGTLAQRGRNSNESTCAPPNGEEEGRRRNGRSISLEDEAIAKAWHEFAAQHSSTVLYSPTKWPEAARALREIDCIPTADLQAALEFAKRDDFWRSNALSLPALRTRGKNGLRKIENLLGAMRKERRMHAAPQPLRVISDGVLYGDP